jgi:HK97 family phage prohead protease
MNKTYFFQADIKSVEESDNGAVFIEGFASTPDIDRYKDIVEPKAFKDALDMFMKNPTMLRSHNPDRPVGVWLSAVVSFKGLKVRGEVKEAQMKQEVKDGLWRALSIGYIPTESKLEHEDGTPFDPEKDSIWDSNLVRKITKLDLIEISIVSTPANGNALFTLAKSAKLYFNELVTKSFMNIKNNEEPGMGSEPVVEEASVSDETEEKNKPEEEEKEIEAETKSEEEVPEEKTAEVPEDEANAPAGDEATTPPGEESENAGENPAPATEEAPKGDDESATEDETTDEENAGDDESGEQAINVDEETAKELSSFVQAGVMAVAKDVKSAIEIPKQIKTLLSAMSVLIDEQKQTIENLNVKLSATPEKRAFKIAGQYEDAKDESKSEGESKNSTEPKKSVFGAALKNMIQNAKPE